MYGGSMELPYIAGLFDGEGSVSITKPSASCPRRHRLIVQIAMTHEETIRAIQRQFGGRVQRIVQSKYNSNARDRFDWRLSDTAAYQFLRIMQPMLITKAAAVEIALRFPFGKAGRRLPDEILTQREQLRVQLGKENRRGR